MSEKLTLNEKMDALSAKTEWFYSNEFKLEEAMEKYKEAINLANELEDDLNKLKNELEVLSKDFSK